MVQNWLGNRWLELVARWLLGVLFVYASYHKIVAPAEFAKILYGYGLFPGEIINLIAIILPFVELVTGCALITGVYARSAALIIMGMLVLFISFIAINLARGHEFDCGCFSANESNPFFTGTPWGALGRDFILIFLGLYVFKFKHDRTRILIAKRNSSVAHQIEDDHLSRRNLR